ncbi:MAG: dihydrolipoamide succinyltransferase [Gammaproteobacteria bacterium RIFCSPHIGHO2_12_FULL_41_15]|nr:MAG: dihydrolipoamide succinyltransferase [Gammaproteobacteria bacterium RIFCSPHIGHO2_12_FULL_41_15]
MAIELKVPTLPESVADATIAKWYKQPGDTVERDENLLDLETDKVMLEVPAPYSGVIESIAEEEGAVVTSGQVLALLKERSDNAAALVQSTSTPEVVASSLEHALELSPAVRRLVSEHNVDVNLLEGTGKNGRILKEDVMKVMETSRQASSQASRASSAMPAASVSVTGERMDQRVPMSRLRAKVAERLVEVQHTAAILTTFNEVDMLPVMSLRKKYKDEFEKKHAVRLGFMSFFVKAVINALQTFPAVNASIDESDIIYHGYQDIGIAVGSPRGLVVPIIRNAERCSMAEIEKSIADFGVRAQSGKLAIEEMTGGTFTISNAGKFGSMMSTPIINPPQSAILGMHNIVERAVVVNGEIVIRPMMYLALSYDHRIIDGVDAVSFLMMIKQLIEDPARLLLDI